MSLSLGNCSLQLQPTQQIPIAEIAPLDLGPSGDQAEEHWRSMYQSIEAVGLQRPFVVAKKSERSGYVLLCGGNTRLSVVKKMHAESDGRSFAQVPCLVAHWPDKLTAHVKHLITNDLAQSTAFIELSTIIVSLGKRLTTENSKRNLYQSEIAGLFTVEGYPLEQSTYSKMVYVVERLLKLVPSLIHATVGRPQIESIRHIDLRWRARAKKEHGLESADYDELCRTLMEDLGIDDWDLDWFEEELRNSIEIRTQTISSPPIILEMEDQLEPDSLHNESSSSDELGNQTFEPNQNTRVDPILGLRKECYTIALGLARHFELERCIAEAKAAGVGFVVTAAPHLNCSDMVRAVWESLYVIAHALDSILVKKHAQYTTAASNPNRPGFEFALLMHLEDEQWDDLMDLCYLVCALNERYSQVRQAIPTQEVQLENTVGSLQNVV